jgi:hypothetical protein
LVHTGVSTRVFNHISTRGSTQIQQLINTDFTTPADGNHVKKGLQTDGSNYVDNLLIEAVD